VPGRTVAVISPDWLPGRVENVTDRIRNPFGMSPPCERRCSETVPAVYGYGDANADFHVVGDHPGVHGGTTTGIPFTEKDGSARLRGAFAEAGLLSGREARTATDNVFFSYLHMCCADGSEPTPDAYADLERFFDAEFRAINAHVILPVGRRAIRYVLAEHSAQLHRIGDDPADLHATEVRGRGYRMLPVAAPEEWTEDDEVALVARLSEVLESDYRQISDLGRFQAGEDPYWVR